ncbi:hypothetical protein ABPG77_010677 [Micractinium sp. CCAP 211/92]
MLAYSKVSKAEKIRRRLAILDVQAQKYIKEFEHAVAKEDVHMQDVYHSLWKRVDKEIQLLQTSPKKYEREHGL